jgi:hypothetical protein
LVLAVSALPTNPFGFGTPLRLWPTGTRRSTIGFFRPPGLQSYPPLLVESAQPQAFAITGYLARFGRALPDVGAVRIEASL